MKARIDIIPGVSVQERACVIVQEPEYYALFTLDASNLPDEVAASSPDPRRLSEYAFGAGALSVRHDYDLREGPQ